MAHAYAEFGSFDVPDILAQILVIEARAGLAFRNDIVAKLAEVYDGILGDLNRIAREVALEADAKIIGHVIATKSANRPEKADSNHLLDHIHSQPGPLGAVSVGVIEELDKVVNPIGNYGPYWRAQEYGTGQGQIPTQIGRTIFGTFEESGTPPDSTQRGLGVGSDAAFIPGGANPGLGTIHEDLPGRHFLKDGTEEALALYTALIEEMQAKWVARLDEIMLTLI